MTPRPAPHPAPTGPGSGVEVLRWPEDGARREQARREGRPRLLLLAPGTAPPPPEPAEDWAWSPIDERDLASRLRRLASPAGAVRMVPGTDRTDPPAGPETTVDHDGVLRAGGRILPLPAVEAALLRCLGERPIGVRRREELAEAAWGEAGRTRRSLDSRILTLRRRIAPLGLGIATVRGVGFVLVAAPAGGGEPER